MAKAIFLLVRPAAPDSITDLSHDASWKGKMYPTEHDVLNPLTEHPISRLRNFCRWLSPGNFSQNLIFLLLSSKVT